MMTQEAIGRIGVNSAVLVQSMQTGELLRVKLVQKPEHGPLTCYNGRHSRHRKKGPQRTSIGEEENGFIQVSDESPLGRALLGKERGDIVTVEAPAGVFAWEIIEVLNRDSKGV